MCQILFAKTSRPTDDDIDDAEAFNDDGIGIMAFDAKGSPVWRKGLTVAQTKAFCAALPMPFAVHFRMGTEGPNIPSLAHPFPIEERPSLKLRGRGRPVVMHNGMVPAWKPIALAAGVDLGPTTGPWSDTRAVVAALAFTGEDLLDSIDGKWILFDSRFRVQRWGQWHSVRAGLLSSAPSWTPSAAWSWEKR